MSERAKILMMPAAKYDDVRNILAEHDADRSIGGLLTLDDTKSLRDTLAEYFSDRETSNCVLGFDIYRYSDMPREAQRVVPTLFRRIYDVASGICRNGERFIFQNTSFEGRFVSTGDGGFQVLETPLHAVLFACFFELALAAYNGFYVLPKLRQLVGSLSVRYAITLDALIEQDGNFFGPAIIRNARILARDTLNRCLLDHRSVEWLQANLVSVESLLTLTSEGLRRVPAFRAYDGAATESVLFGCVAGEGIRAVHL